MLSSSADKLQPAAHRRLRKIMVAFATLLIVAIVGDGILGMIFRSRIASAVEHGMGADFSAGLAWYIPPRGVSLHHVRISKMQPDGNREEYFAARRVVLKLGEFPKPNRAMLITLLRIDSPTVTIISDPPANEKSRVSAKSSAASAPIAERTRSNTSASGDAGRFPLAAIAPLAVAAPVPAVVPSRQKIEIRNLVINDGELNMESPGQDAFVIEHVNLSLNPSGDGTHIYRFSAGADQKSATTLQSAGSINVDDSTLTISDLTVQAKIGAILSQAHLSGEVRRRLEVAKVGGTLNIRGSASVPLHDWWKSTYSADIQLAEGKGLLPGSLAIETATGDIHLERDGKTSAIVRNFIAASGASRLTIEGGKFTTTADRRNWQVSDVLGRLDLQGGVPALETSHLKGRFTFTAKASGPANLPKDVTLISAVEHEIVLYPRDASVQPPKFPIPLDHINGGPVICRAGVVRFDNISANYGGDQVLLDQAHLTLDDPLRKMAPGDLRSQIRIEGIAGTLVCKQPGPAYPAGLGKVIAQLRPSGQFVVGGESWYAINRKLPGDPQKLKPDYFFRISTAGGAFALTDHKIPVTNIQGDAVASAMLVDIQKFRGETLGGTIIATAKVTPVRPVVYDTTATLYNVNLQNATRAFALDLKKPLIGQMYLKTHIRGQGPGGDVAPLQTFAAEGEFQIADGNFGDIQTVRAAATNVTKADQVLDGQAAGVFSIAKEVVTLENCAVGNPMFGLEGSGTIGFDKTLNLHAVAAPLGDWREGLKQSNIPVLDNIGSDIAGGIQQLFAGAQQTLLWDIHISGTTTAPNVQQTAAPVITKPVAMIFGQLLRGAKDNGLIDQVRGKK